MANLQRHHEDIRQGRGRRGAASVSRTAATMLLLLCAMPRATLGCILVHDAAAGQMLKIEAHGPNALRVRAVPSSPEHNFRDDLVSALEPLPPNAVCADADAAVLVAPANYSNGNLRAQLDAAGLLSFWRVSDGDNGLLLKEAAPRALQPAAATALQGFLSLDLAFEAVEGERIYGLGQHKTGALDNKGVAGLKLAPQNTEILVPVAHSSVGARTARRQWRRSAP